MTNKGRSVLITGFDSNHRHPLDNANASRCSSGIGKALAIEFHSKGPSINRPVDTGTNKNMARLLTRQVSMYSLHPELSHR
jgi:hypothetical protein